VTKKIIQFFKFQFFNLSEFYDLAYLILVNILTSDKAQAFGVIVAYNEAKASFDKLTEIFRRNPEMHQTEKLVNAIVDIRKKMIALKTMLRGMLSDPDEARIESVKTIKNVAHPYLKNAHKALAANGMEMADALRTAATLPLLTQFGLKTIVDDITALSHKANEILLERGKEKALRKYLGNSTATRRKLEKQLRFLFYFSIPAHYIEATGLLSATFEHTTTEINVALNSFRHLISSNGDLDV
jgi:hypothetical protein